eukprot:4329293-Pleurochrysis_carterae.AAC.4
MSYTLLCQVGKIQDAPSDLAVGLRSSFYVVRQYLSIVARGHINSKEFRSGFHHNILRIRCQLTLSHSGERHTVWHSAGSDLTSGYVEELLSLCATGGSLQTSSLAPFLATLGSSSDARRCALQAHECRARCAGVGPELMVAKPACVHHAEADMQSWPRRWAILRSPP